MIRLDDIAQHTQLTSWTGPKDAAVSSIVFDSRKATAGTLFVAVKGTRADGHDFVAQVVAQGCTAIVTEHAIDVPETVTQLVVPNSSKALGELAHAFYGFPSRELTLVGVTGTNGKTTCTTLLHKLYMNLGFKTGLLSTVVNLIGEEPVPATHTTPDPVALNALLADMVSQGCSHCFMEVSSHAVDQHRIAGLEFAGGAFTNITHDHLDYHKDMEDYFDAKTKLSELLDRVEKGEVITITRHGVPIARLEPYVPVADAKRAQRSLDALSALREEFVASGPGMTLHDIRDAIADGRR